MDLSVLHCKLCNRMPIGAKKTLCNHYYCGKCLDVYLQSGQCKCLKCSKKITKGIDAGEQEMMLREAFPDEYKDREDTSLNKLDATKLIKMLETGITELTHKRDNLYSKVRGTDIGKQAFEYFGTSRKYSIIVADVPWNYPNQRFNGSIKRKYSQMKDEEIYALPVEGLCRENAALLFWTTFPKLQIALNTIYAWGFRYATCFVAWSKLYPRSNEICAGGGCYTRPNTEICLLGLRGEMSKQRMRDTCETMTVVTTPFANPLISSEISEQSPESGTNSRLIGHHEDDETRFWETVQLGAPLFTARKTHSEKPQESYEKIMKIFGDLPRIDLFARKRRFGWDSFGDQLDMFPPDVPIDDDIDMKWKKRQDVNADFSSETVADYNKLWDSRTKIDVNFV